MTIASTDGIEPTYGYRELEQLGEGSRWRIDRAVRDGTYPPADFYIGRSPRWLASTIQKHRGHLIAANERRSEAV